MAGCCAGWRRVAIVGLCLLTTGHWHDCLAQPAGEPPVLDRNWLHLYVRDRRQREALVTLQELARDPNRSNEMFAQLQWMLEQPEDSWTLTPEGPRSIRQQLRIFWERQPEEVQTRFRERIRSRASLDLSRARDAGSPILYLKVLREFPFSEAADEAADWLIARWLDEGAFDLAANLSRRNFLSSAALLASERLNLAVAAAQLAGRGADAETLRARLRERAPGELRSLPESQNRRDSLVQPESITRNAIFTTSAPVLRPDWTVSLESLGSHPELVTILEAWSNQQREQDRPTAIGWTPITAPGRVIYRDLDTIRCLDDRTGATIWRYSSHAGLGQLLGQAEAALRSGRPIIGMMVEPAAANSLVSTISTDGRRIYAIDDAEGFTAAANLALNPTTVSENRNRRSVKNGLVALDATADDAHRVVWSTRDGIGRPNEPLAGHAFLGAPLPWNGWAYVISESGGEFCVSALEAETGQLVWKQSIAVAERSIDEDRGRQLRACSPTAAGDLLLCPTQAGLVVAVDALSGELRWAFNALETPTQEVVSGRPRFSPPLSHRHPSAIPGWIRVSPESQCAVYLPSHSDVIYCLELEDGRVRWKRTQPDAEFLGGLLADRVIVTGSGSCTALDLADGDVLWSTSFEGLPAGQGLLTTDAYLLPVDSGEILQIGTSSGRISGPAIHRNGRVMGQLVAAGDRIITVGPAGIAAYPQSQVLRKRLEVDQDIAANPKEHAWRLAEIQFVQGDLSGGIASLETAIRLSENQAERDAWEILLCDAYFRWMREDPAETERILTRTASLHRTLSQRGRWLLAKTEFDRTRGVAGGEEAAILELASLPAQDLSLQTSADEHLAVSPKVWLGILAETQRKEAAWSAIEAQIQARALRDPLGPFGSAAVEIATESRQRQHLRQRMAETALSAGNFHQAAVLLQRNVSAAAPDFGESLSALTGLYESVGLPAYGARTLRQTMGADGSSPQTREILSADGMTAALWKRSQPISWPVDKVRFRVVSQSSMVIGDPQPKSRAIATEAPAELFERYGDFQRRIFALTPDAPLEWLVRNNFTSIEIGVFEKASSRQLQSIELPLGTVLPGNASPSNGLSMTFGLPGEVRTYSLLESGNGGLAWKFTLPEWRGRSGQPLSGPASSTLSLFQLKNTLAAVDTATGGLLWRRNDLDGKSGLYADGQIGLMADDRAVFAMGNDRQSYRLFDAASGRVLRSAKLPFPAATLWRPVAPLGIVTIVESDGQRIQYWDAWNDRIEVQDSIRQRSLYQLLPDGEVAWLNSEGRIRVYSTRHKTMLVDVPAEGIDTAGVMSLRAFTQGGRYFISLSYNQPIARTTHFQSWVSDSLMNMANLRDELIAVEPGNPQYLWRQAIPQRSFLQWRDTPAPFLIACALVRDNRDPNHRWLRVDTYDPKTGISLGVGDRLPLDRLLHADYDGEQGLIRLIGRKQDIELHFDRAAQQTVAPLQ